MNVISEVDNSKNEPAIALAKQQTSAREQRIADLYYGMYHPEAAKKLIEELER